MKATENGANTRGGNESNFFLGRKRVFFFFLKSFFYKFPPQKGKQSVMEQIEASGRKDNTRGSERRWLRMTGEDLLIGRTMFECDEYYQLLERG